MKLTVNRKPRRLTFEYVGGAGAHYLRISDPDRPNDYLGAVDGRWAIRRLRDYLTRSLRRKEGA